MEIKNGLSCNPPTTGQSTKKVTKSLPTLGGNSQVKNTLLSNVIIDDLAKSGLTVEDAKGFGWYEVTDANTLEKITKKDFGACQWMLSNYYVLAFPYPGCDFARVRLYPKTEVAEKTMKERKWKYLQPKDTSPKPYILPQIAELKEKPHKQIIITEGEKKTACLVKNGFDAIGLPGVWQFKKDNEFLLSNWLWKNRTVYICFDNDVVHNENVLQAEIELGLRLYLKGAKVKIIRLPIGDEKGVDDFIVAKGKDNFNKLIEQSKPIFESYTNYEYREVLNRIRHLIDNGLMTYGELDDIINKFAKGMKIKKPAFEKDLNIEKETEKNNTIIEDVEPYNKPVNAVEVTNEIETILKDYVYLPNENEYTATTLWILLTYQFESFSTLPQLLITSPTKRCGKTVLLTVIEALSNKTLLTGNISVSALFRVIEKYKPTLLIDEADTGLAYNDEIRGILNAGHTKRTAFVVRSDTKEKDFEPQRFNVFSPKAIAMINKPKDTQIDRSIVITMERKPADVKIKRMPVDFFEKQKEMRQKLLKLSQTIDLQPTNEEFNIGNYRLLDNWTPLLTIAKSISSGWYEKAKKAMLYFANVEDVDDENTMLLKDIKTFFEDKDVTKVKSSKLVEYLNEIQESPWSDKRSGKGITANWLANKMKSFEIKPKKIRDGIETFRGYEMGQFKKVFAQYIPFSKWNNGTMASEQQLEQLQNGTQKEPCSTLDSQKMASKQECSTVPFSNPENEETEQIDKVLYL